MDMMKKESFPHFEAVEEFVQMSPEHLRLMINQNRGQLYLDDRPALKESVVFFRKILSTIHTHPIQSVLAADIAPRLIDILQDDNCAVSGHG